MISSNNKTLSKLNLFVILLISLVSSFANGATVIADKNFTFKDLGATLEYLEDAKKELGLEGAKQSNGWVPIEGGSFSKGFSNSQYWFRFEMVNKTQTLQNYVLEIRHPFLDTLNIIYQKNNQTLWIDKLGDQLPSSKKRLRHSDFLSDFSLQPNEQLSVYIQVASKSTMQLPAKIWEEDSYKEHNHKSSVLIGILLGIMFAIAAYHLLIYFSILEPVYLYYGFFMSGIVITFGCLNGIPGFFIWPEQSAEADNFLLVGLFTCSIFNCLFARGSVDTPERTPRMNWLINLCAAAGVFGVVSLPILPYPLLLKLAFLTNVLAIIFVVIIFVITSLQRYQPAYYALMGNIIAGLGACITIFDKMGLMPSSSFNASAVYIGFILMALVQAFALSYRIKVTNDLHEASQEELLAAQKQLNSELDILVRKRTEELENVNERLLKLSSTDGLTKLRNRRFFDESLEREYRSAFRNKTHIGVLILDIDHFKLVNDNYGHPFGDICLKEMGEIVKQSVHRVTDVTARYGGEEFIILLPNTNFKGVLCVANVIRDKVKAHIFEDENHSINLTISIGATAEIPDVLEGAPAMIERADKLLYQAKDNDRDQICSDVTLT